MPRKANRAMHEKNNQEIMPKKDIEQYFTAIQQRFTEVDKRFEAIDKRFNVIDKRFDDQNKLIQRRFDEQDNKLQTILEIVQVNDKEHKEIKLDLWEQHRRITKLEKQLA